MFQAHLCSSWLHTVTAAITNSCPLDFPGQLVMMWAHALNLDKYEITSTSRTRKPKCTNFGYNIHNEHYMTLSNSVYCKFLGSCVNGEFAIQNGNVFSLNWSKHENACILPLACNSPSGTERPFFNLITKPQYYNRSPGSPQLGTETYRLR